MALDFDDVIARAKLPERTLSLCLRGDLQAEWEDLERQLAAAQENTRDEALSGNPDIRDLADRMVAVSEEMAGCEVVFRFRGLGAKTYSDLLVKNKAADDDPDAVEGLDWTIYPTALIAACAIDPVMTIAQVGELSERVSARQWDDLFSAALATNRSQVSIPFSLSASAIRASTEPNSKRRELGVSPAAGSLDESLFEPPLTNTTTTAA